MAIVRLDPHLLALHGRIGEVVYKTYRDKIVATRVPRFDGYIPTAAQRARRQRMAEATAYAKRICADPAAKAVYIAAAKQLHRHPFRLAVSDYLKGCPRVEDRSDLETRRPRRVAQPSNPPNLFTGGNREHGARAGHSPFPPFPPVNRFSFGPCRVGLTPRSLRAPRHSSPSRPPRPWLEAFRASIIEPPRRGRRGSSSPQTTVLLRLGTRRPRRGVRDSRHDSAFPFFRVSAIGLGRKEIAAMTDDRGSAERRKRGNKSRLAATALLDLKQRATPALRFLVTFCKMEQATNPRTIHLRMGGRQFLSA